MEKYKGKTVVLDLIGDIESDRDTPQRKELGHKRQADHYALRVTEHL